MSIISYLYSHLYLEFDEEEIEHTAVFTESIAQSFFAFMVSQFFIKTKLVIVDFGILLFGFSNLKNCFCTKFSL